MVQRIMNTVEETSTGVTPAELILNNSIRLSARILAPPGSNTPGSQIALSDTLDNWVARQHTLITVAQAHQLHFDSHLLAEYPIHSYVLFTPPVGPLARHEIFDGVDRIRLVHYLEWSAMFR